MLAATAVPNKNIVISVAAGLSTCSIAMVSWRANDEPIEDTGRRAHRDLAERDALTPGVQRLFDRDEGAFLGEPLSGLGRGQGEQIRGPTHQLAGEPPQCLAANRHRRPLLLHGVDDVRTHRCEQVGARLRRESLGEEHGLAQRHGLLVHGGAGAIEGRPHIGGEKADEQPEDHHERRERHGGDRSERGAVTYAAGERHDGVRRRGECIAPDQHGQGDDGSRLCHDPAQHWRSPVENG
jgi:hypothetical protein